MKFLEGFGFGWWSSGLLFWVLVLMIDLPISCSYKTLAIILLTLEAIIFFCWSWSLGLSYVEV